MNPPAPSPELAPALEIRGLSRRYPQGGGVDAVDLTVGAWERLAVVGPSGSGKSTLLRLIAGLERPDAGEIRVRGEPANDRPPHRRGLAMVFQEQPPYPHLDVAGNLAFGLRARGCPRAERRRRVAEIAELLGIATLLPRSPARLSGGERRRVVLGRALATRPDLLLLDEPFSALDPPLSASIRSDLIDLHEGQGGAIVLVTHDQAEAMAFGHRLAVIRGGRIVQVGDPRALYERPSDRFVAEFLGDPGASVLRCRVRVGPDAARVDGLIPGASWAVPRGTPWAEAMADRADPEVDLALRPEHVEAVGPDDPPGAPPEPTVVGRVTRVEPEGPSLLVTARVGPHRLRFRSRPRGPGAPSPGDRIPLRLRLGRASWFDPATGAALAAPDPGAA